MISIYYTSISLGTAKLYWLLTTIRSKTKMKRKEYDSFKRADIAAAITLVFVIFVWYVIITATTYEPPCDCMTDLECEVTLCSHLGE